MLDLIVRGGTVVTASETFKADIGVEGEKISYIASPGKLDYLVNENADKMGTSPKSLTPGINM